jgi:hypothetical protein
MSSMAPQSLARSESIAAFIPALELLITEAMEGIGQPASEISQPSSEDGKTEARIV